MTDGITFNDMTSRRTGEIIFNRKTVEYVNQCARWFTNGAVEIESTSRFHCVVKGLPGERLTAPATCAYLIGAMHGYARVSGGEIPEEMVPFLRDVQEAYRAGETHRYGLDEAKGAKVAKTAWEASRDA